jgi:hypothetical protein
MLGDNLGTVAAAAAAATVSWTRSPELAPNNGTWTLCRSSWLKGLNRIDGTPCQSISQTYLCCGNISPYIYGYPLLPSMRLKAGSMRLISNAHKSINASLYIPAGWTWLGRRQSTYFSTFVDESRLSHRLLLHP